MKCPWMTLNSQRGESFLAAAPFSGLLAESTCTLRRFKVKGYNMNV